MKRNPINPIARDTSAALLATALAAGAANAQVTKETADVFGQGLENPMTVMEDGATLRRHDSGLSFSIRMPTPASGTYDYPGPSPFQGEGAMPGHPEAFSLWVFVFNFPNQCEDNDGDVEPGCGPADFSAGRGDATVFSGGGHVVGGDHLQIGGRVRVNSEPFLDERPPLLEPETAAVHLAIAPHGALQPDVMPNQISTPIGNPNDHWWFAVFE